MLGHICISDINEALPRALPLLAANGVSHTAASVANARETIEWPGLFVTEYWRPQRNCLFDPVRDANPFFHFLEALWIIAGRNDTRFLTHVLPRMAEYSDDGDTFHGAYGHRLRHYTGWTGFEVVEIDQLLAGEAILRHSPTTRQVVMGIWNPALDLGTTTKDMPCNDMLMFKIRQGALNITVSNRSNDAIWGCYGANAVQFSMLQMYLAAKLGVRVGTYCQVSDSFHVYTDSVYWQWFSERYKADPNRWAEPLHDSRNLYAHIGDQNIFADHIELVDMELETFFIEADIAVKSGGAPIPLSANSLVMRTATKLWNVLFYHRVQDHAAARSEAWTIEAPDWREAATRWLQRRAK